MRIAVARSLSDACPPLALGAVDADQFIGGFECPGRIVLLVRGRDRDRRVQQSDGATRAARRRERLVRERQRRVPHVPVSASLQGRHDRAMSQIAGQPGRVAVEASGCNRVLSRIDRLVHVARVESERRVDEVLDGGCLRVGSELRRESGDG